MTADGNYQGIHLLHRDALGCGVVGGTVQDSSRGCSDRFAYVYLYIIFSLIKIHFREVI